MDDDDLSFDDVADDDDLVDPVDVDETENEAKVSIRGIASWRRIEMAREDKYLQSVLADLDDFYDFEDVDGEIVASYTD
jgi:hypothetical protein